MIEQKRLLICDLDNTLYDWVEYFVPSFYAMVDTAVQITGIDRERLLSDFRAVHQSVRDSEHPFSLLLTDSIKERYDNRSRAEVIKILDPAFHAFNSARKRQLTLYPGVREGLEHLVKNGVTLVAHTESKTHGVVDRMRRLNLFHFFKIIYCRERTESELTPALDPTWFGDVPREKITELKDHQAKPNPAVLMEICRNENMSNFDTAYVGDSLYRDVLMANRANVFAIWAKYGSVHREGFYEKLIRISHWSDDEIERERLDKQAHGPATPDAIAETSFTEVAKLLGY